MDRYIPIAAVCTGDYGVGVAIDIEGNCRFYDFFRLRKLAKISAKATINHSTAVNSKFRLLPKPVICSTPEAFLGLV